ncbi:MAG: monovalent cation/H+ antiporter subunit D family protein [Tenericutes bacterium HGW-Tenericutes-6]|jgi:multicomponent Na+:H+ antiporter subunit D|nr:MAG: monovalent cation/H+ antiporter subunit D family protein [Tenericutes bacterium HGW-Tenericutes-6]
MNIEQLPIINLLLFLLMALVIPLLKRKPFKITLILGFVVLGLVLISSGYLLWYVNNVEVIHYTFGGHEARLGIEFIVDPFSALFTTIIAGLAAIIYIYSSGDATEGIEKTEYGRYYVLLFILLMSMFGILYTNDLFNTYVFIEILSITTCAIISIKKKKDTYTSAFRYVMMNELGSLSYLFGVALIYMATGFTNITLISESIQNAYASYPVNIIVALGFMIIGLGIKAAIFPFHIWLPDAHSAAPSTSSAILSAIVIKVYILVLVKVLFRVFKLDILNEMNISTILLVLAGVAMIMGSVFAIAQKDVKRMLGYSSVAQMGYILLGIGLLSFEGLRAAFFHILSHGLMKTALFLSVGEIIYYKKTRKVNDFDGMGFIMPVAMGVFSIAALGMIGIPLTSGFISKLNLGVAVLDQNQIIFLVILIVSSLLNVIYYLPIIILAFLKNEKYRYRLKSIEPTPRTMIAPLVLLGVLIVVVGLFPNQIMIFIEAAANSLLP